MKKILFLLFLLLNISGGTIIGQSLMNPPRVMVVPGDTYCNIHGFMADGNTPNYQKAILNDVPLVNVLDKITDLIRTRDKGVEIIEINSAIEGSKENEMIGLANDASDAESIADAIVRASEADIIIKVDFNITSRGPSKYMNVSLKAIDAFTHNTISSKTGESAPSTYTDEGTLAREAVYSVMDDFLDQILVMQQRWVQKGKPLNIELRATNGSKYNLKSKVGDGMVFEHVEDFLYDNAKDERGVQGSGSSATMKYPSVYFPLQIKGRRGKTVRVNSTQVGVNLTNYLETVGIQSDFFCKGPGHLIVFIK